MLVLTKMYHILLFRINCISTSCEILRSMPPATSHYLSQCDPVKCRNMASLGHNESRVTLFYNMLIRLGHFFQLCNFSENFIPFVTVNISYMEQKHTFDCLACTLHIVKRMRNAEVNRTKWQTLDFAIAVICGHYENSKYHESWSRHDMELFSTLLAPARGIHRSPIDFQTGFVWFAGTKCGTNSRVANVWDAMALIRRYSNDSNKNYGGHRLNFVTVTVPDEINK